jgi:type IV pilus assembly protein PilF
MRHSFMAVALCVSLLGAASLQCHAKSAAVPKANDPALSYRGQSAVARAQESINKGNFADALKYADAATKSDPKSGVPYMVKAYVFQQQKDFSKAGSFYSKAVSLSPLNGLVLNAYGVFLCESGQYDKADAIFLKSASNSTFELALSAYENATQCSLINGDMVRAENHARAVLTLNPESPGALETLAQVKFKQSAFLEARAFLQRREALGPLSIPLLQLATQIEKSAGDDRAASQYKKQLDTLLQAQIQPPTGEGQKKP